MVLCEAATLGALASAIQCLPPAVARALSHDPSTHVIGACGLVAGYFTLRIAREKATGSRRLAARLAAVTLLVVGSAWALGDRFLWVFDALAPDRNVRARGVAEASVAVGLCGLWIWRWSPLRR